MWQRTDYLSKLGLSFDAKALEGIVVAEVVFKELGAVSLDPMFIGTRLEDNVPKYGTLWFFSDTHIYSCTDFMSDNSRKYGVSLRGTVRQLAMNMNGFDPSKVSKSAQMSVDWTTKTNLGFNMNAHGENCNQLYEIAKRYLVPQ